MHACKYVTMIRFHRKNEYVFIQMSEGCSIRFNRGSYSLFIQLLSIKFGNFQQGGCDQGQAQITRCMKYIRSMVFWDGWEYGGDGRYHQFFCMPVRVKDDDSMVPPPAAVATVSLTYTPSRLGLRAVVEVPGEKVWAAV